MKVLLAEDDAVSRCILEEMLHMFGYEVTACENGRQAWDAYRHGGYQLVISDWMMPEMDGLELCRKIRNEASSPYCYFILQSANQQAIDDIHNIAWRADSYLLKPFDGDQLKAHLKAAEKVLALESRVQSLLEVVALCACCQKSICEDARFQDLTLRINS